MKQDFETPDSFERIESIMGNYKEGRIDEEEEKELVKLLGASDSEIELMYPSTLMRCMTSMPKSLRKNSDTPEDRAINKFTNLKYDAHIRKIQHGSYAMFLLGLNITFIDFLHSAKYGFSGSYLRFGLEAVVTLTSAVLLYDTKSKTKVISTAIFTFLNSSDNDADVGIGSPSVNNESQDKQKTL